MFSFTFTQSGNYVFQDASSSTSLLIITVKGFGESCGDPDRFLQVMSGDSLSQMGISQRNDIILKPNYPLIASMTVMLFAGTAFIMWMVSYCMRKGWNIRRNALESFRETQLSVNIHHQNETLFDENNDFINFKSDLIDHAEEDLDGCNLDI